MNRTQQLSHAPHARPRAGRAGRAPLVAIAAALALAALAPVAARAGGAGAAARNAPLPVRDSHRPTANQLLRQAVANQEILPASGYFTWMDRVEGRKGSVTKRMVMTPEGILSRTVAINGRALTPEERRTEEARIDRLLDQEEMREKARTQQQLLQRIDRLLRAVPDAFDCAYQPIPGSKTQARPFAVLSCSPKPDYSPPNREAQVLTGMNAVITIDLAERRMTRFEGTLFEDVTFAWGFLARLNRGGYLELRQKKLEGGPWCVAGMELRIGGRLLMVKPFHLQRRETGWDYRAVPSMSVAQALDFLRRAPEKEAPPAR
jgi:hypothetical protein